MVDYAYKQLDLAVSKWEEITTIDSAYDLAFTTKFQIGFW